MKLKINCVRDGRLWVARADDFPGLVGRGASPDQAADKLVDAITEELDDIDQDSMLELLILDDMFDEW